MERFKVGDTVKHFKRETLSKEELETNKYLYKILAFAQHTERPEMLVVYQALYPDKNGECGVYARPYEMFSSEVNREKYPDIKQKYRLEVVELQ